MKVLVVVAHPDDELLGAGPLIWKHLHAGHDVSVQVFTENSARHGMVGASGISLETAAKAWGYKVSSWNMEDQSLDTIRMSHLTQRLEASLKDFTPDLVYTHLAEDLNRDHRVVSEVCRVVFRRFATLVEFPTPSSSEYLIGPWMPNWYVPLDEGVVDMTWEAFQSAYPQEVEPYPHARSKEAHKAFYAAGGAASGASYAIPLKIVCLRGIIGDIWK